MQLLIDVGNSWVKWLLVRAGEVHTRGAYDHGGSHPKDWGPRLWRELARPTQVVIANVAGPEVASALAQWSRTVWDVEAHFAASEANYFGISNGYDKPNTLGVDRWVALIGSRTLTRRSCTVIDCGTATTIDALTAAGQHLGGVIIPGVRLMRAALYRSTQIPQQDDGAAVVLGRNTRDGIWGGTLYALAAAIDCITEQMADHLPGRMLRLLTGGHAEAVLPLLRHRYRLEADLVFHGLRVIADELARRPYN